MEDEALAAFENAGFGQRLAKSAPSGLAVRYINLRR